MSVSTDNVISSEIAMTRPLLIESIPVTSESTKHIALLAGRTHIDFSGIKKKIIWYSDKKSGISSQYMLSRNELRIIIIIAY